MERPTLYEGPPVRPVEDQPVGLVEALARTADRFPDAGVVSVSGSDADAFLGYPELLDRARRTLTGLRRHGLGAGDPAVLYGLESPAELFTAYWACVLGGVRPLLMAAPTDPTTTDAVRPRLRHALQRLGGSVVLCGPDSRRTLPAEVRAVDVTDCATASRARRLHRPDLDDVAMLMMSSGSTGLPKLIPLTHRGLQEFAVGTPDVLPLRPGDTTLNWLPLDHSGAFLLYHLLAVVVGCTNVHARTDLILAQPLRWLDLVAQYRVNHTWAPNFGYQLVNHALAAEPRWHRDLSSLRTLVSGGEQITVPVVTEFFRATAEFGVRPETFVPAWGMTETVTAITFGRPGLAANLHRALGADPTAPQTLVAVGSPAPGAGVRVVTEDGQVASEGRIGRLQVRSARVTPGYLGEPDRNAAAFVTDHSSAQVWFDTGDLAFGVDGQIVMVGRTGDRIVLNGQTYYAHDLEDVAGAVAGVPAGLVAACGVPDEASGTDRLAVFFGVDPAADDAATVRGIQAEVFRRLRLTASVIPVPSADFPRTPSGKIQRSVLRRRLLDGELRAAPPAARPDAAPPGGAGGAEVRAEPAAGSAGETERAAPGARPRPRPRPRPETVRAVCRAVLGAGADEDAGFYELGVDSLTVARLHEALERECGIRLRRAAMFEHPSIAALTRHICAMPAEPAAGPGIPGGPAQDVRVAIIGMAVRFPGADTLEGFWANLVGGVESVRRFGPDELAAAGVPADEYRRPDFVPVSGAIDGIDRFDADFFGITPREAALTDPAHRLFLECCYHALEHGGYAGRTGPERVGVFAGSGMNLYTHQNYLVNNLGTDRRADPVTAMQTVIGSQPDFLASRVAYRLGLTGPAIGVQTACSTSLVAVHLAVNSLLAGEADLVLAGAAAVHVPQATGYLHHPGSILSGTGQCRAFDADADGTVGGSGVAAVLLKRLDRAVADGDTIHAVILGSAVNNDGTGKVGFVAPSVPGQVDVIERALDRAAVPAESISYLEAHGTGTPLGDPVELRAASRALANRTERVEFCRVGSVKPNIGHLDSCAGMAGLVKTVLMLSHRTFVPLLNFRRPNPELDLDATPLVLGVTGGPWTTDGHPRRAGVSAFGVGGTNAHVVLEEAPSAPARPAPDGSGPVVLPLSAAHPDALAELVHQMRDHLRAHPEVSVADLAATLALGRPHLRHRVAVVGGTAHELAAALGRATPGQVPETGPGPLAFAFSGQGTARPGMADRLYDAFPRFREVLDACAECHGEPGGEALLKLLRDRHPGQARWPTETAQPAIFAYQVALAELWRSFGVEPDFVVGHSVGEYAALYVAGAITIEDGMRLLAERGRLAQRRTASGAMLATFTDPDTAREVCARAGVELAAVNGPDEQVVAGTSAAVQRATEWLDARGVRWQRLPVDRAFHSRLVDPVLDAFAERAAAVSTTPLRTPLASTVTGELLSAGTVVDADYLRRQLRQPVRFADALNTLAQSGCRRFLEVGPDDVLSAIGRRGGSGGVWVPSQRRDLAPVPAVRQAVADLFRAGGTVDWTALTGAGRRIPLPAYPFRRERHWTASLASDTGATSGGQAAVAPARDAAVLSAEQAAGLSAGQAAGLSGNGGRRTSRAGVGTPTTAVAAPGNGRVAEPPETLAAVRELVARHLGRPVVEIGPDARFLDLGADSLVMLGMIQEVRQTYRKELPARLLFTDADTPRRLAAVVVEDEDRDAPPAPTGVSAPAVPDPHPEPAAGAAPVALSVDGATPLVSSTSGPKPTVGRAGRRSTDFSLYFFGDYPDQEQHDKYGAIVEAARFADRHGFHAVWLPERHFHSFGGLFPNPVVLAAALARETTRVRLNAGSVVLPLHHPVRVAEEWSVVDNLSNGRVGLCVASGWHANDFALNPAAFGGHRDLMYEHLATVRTLWGGGSLPARSGSGEEIELRIYPRPIQPMPPLAVAVVSNPDSYRAAATADLGVVTNLMAQSVEQLADNIALYRATRAEHGLDPLDGRVVVLVHTYLGDDLERVQAEAFGPFCSYLRSSLSLFGQVTNSLGLRIDEDTPAEDVDFMLERAYERYCAGRALIGTPDSVAPMAERLRTIGVDEIACFVDFGVSAGQMLRSLPAIDEVRQRMVEPVGSKPAFAPLSPAQRGMWFLDRLHPGSGNYHESKAVRLDGPLDVAALRRALRRVVERQAALRTVVREVAGQPRQVVLPEVDVECPLMDRSGMLPEAAIRSALDALGSRPFDLATGPLIRVELLRTAPEQHVLVLYVQHIVFDSFSTAVFVRDLSAYYRADVLGEADRLAPLPTSFAEHVRDRVPNAEAKARAIEHWRQVLADAPPLRLPVGGSGSPAGEPAGKTIGAALVHTLDAELAAGVEEFSRRHRVTPFMTLAGVIAGVLGRFGGQHDLVLGTAVTDRPPGTEDLVGLFIDSVPLRIDLGGDPTLGRLAQRVRDVSLAAYAHSGVGFDELVSAINPGRDAARNPLFQVMVEYEQALDVDFDLPGLRATPIDVPVARAPLDLTIYLSHSADGIQCVVEYDRGLLDEETVRRLLRYVETALRRAVANPPVTLSELTAPTQPDAATLAGFRTGRSSGPPACLHQLVERQASRTPDAVAVIDGADRLTYRELDRRANAMAWRLRDLGAGPERIVAIHLPRGREMIVAILGVLKAGAAYLPLEPAVPTARLAIMAGDSGACLLVTDNDRVADQLGLRAVAVADDDPRADHAPVVTIDPNGLAYCIYTSGTTGRPKGVMVPHRGPANLVAWYLRERPALRTAHWVSVSFDVSVQEIFTTLASGEALVIVSDDDRYDPAAAAETVRRHGVQRLFMTPTPLRYLVATDPALPSLREVVAAGEELVLTPALRRFLTGHPECALYNEYGPTEASIIATSHRVVPADGDRPPIGRPVDDVVVWLLDDQRLPVPPGAVGEIHLGGGGLARGYVGRPRDTADAFVPDPSADGRRLYRTGDLGCWQPDGTLRYLGRGDDQVKIRGNRVEPGEVAHALTSRPEVRDAAVLAGTDPHGETCLVAYVVPSPDGSPPSGDGLARQLAGVLPHHLVPAAWVWLDALPVTASGKLDRGRLPEPVWERSSAGEPATASERALHDLWCAELGLSRSPVDVSFFELGGHSLTAVGLVARIGQALGVDLRVADLFQSPTIRALADRLDSLPRSESGLPDPAVDTPRSEVVAASSFQRRAWRCHHNHPFPAVYNVPYQVRLEGDLDVTALERALANLARRHPVLRTRFLEVDGGLRQEVLAGVVVRLPVTDLTDRPDDLDSWCRAAAEAVIPPDQAPLWRVRLARLDHRRWTLVLVLHHLICDGWSMGVIWRELSALYAAQLGRGDGVPEPPGSYPDYVRWRSARLDRDRAELVRFWRAQLAGAPLRVPLPYDRPRPARLSGAGAVHRFRVSGSAARAVRSAATDTGGTPAAVLTAAFAAWLGRTCRERDLVLALSSASRTRPEHERVVGPVGEALLVRLTRRIGMTFRDLVRQVGERTFTALDNNLLGLGEVAEALGVELLAPQVMLTVATNSPAKLRLPGVTADVAELAVTGVARTELYAFLSPGQDDVEGAFEYSTDLFTEETVAGWADGFVATLAALCAAPERRLESDVEADRHPTPA
ncbi:amino acid adenylation domain-containing protein [Micromonosporaceae bacterium B7E4]